MPAAGARSTAVSMCCSPWPVSWNRVVTCQVCSGGDAYRNCPADGTGPRRCLRWGGGRKSESACAGFLCVRVCQRRHVTVHDKAAWTRLSRTLWTGPRILVDRSKGLCGQIQDKGCGGALVIRCRNAPREHVA
eukprot:scaffold16623_cov93-Isochrysis_galbana.AAC.3